MTRARASTAEPAAEWVPLDAVTSWADNPRKNDGEPVDKVADSIKRFGFAAPIVARRETGEIIAGHTRWKAAHKLGLDRVPVRFVDLDPADAHLLAVADNKLSELAEWDNETLSRVLSSYGLEDAALAGFDEKELDKLGTSHLDANFQPGSADDQSRLDERAAVTCPQCGHEFTPPAAR